VVPNIFSFWGQFLLFCDFFMRKKKRKIWKKSLFSFNKIFFVKCGFSSRIHHFHEIKKIEEGENIGWHHLVTISC